MDSRRTHEPNSPAHPPPVDAGRAWSGGIRLPLDPSRDSLLLPCADTAVEVSASEVRGVMNSLSVLVAKLKWKQIVVPPSVDEFAMDALLAEWRSKGNIVVGRNTQGELIVKSNPINSNDFQSHFAVLNAERLPLIAGLLTDRNLRENWPPSWRNYEDLKDKRLLDHCCGSGQKVALLGQQGVEAHGVDISLFGSSLSEGLHYGRAERLPFQNQVFDRVESRMGVLLWGQDNKQMCREVLAEMIRVTKDGGTIRLSPVRDVLIQELALERPEVLFLPSPPKYSAAFELLIKHQAQS